MLVLSVFLTAGAAIKLITLDVKNKTGHDIFVELNPKYKDEGMFYYLTVYEDEEPKFTILPAVYKVQVFGSKDGVVWNCFGEADEEYWDENRAVREMDFTKGSRLVVKSCPEPVLAWYALDGLKYKYPQMLWKYVY